MTHTLNPRTEALAFNRVKGIHSLACFLNTTAERLELLIEQPQYSTFRIRKSTGGFREIEAPEPLLKTAQRKINVVLQAGYNRVSPDCAHGFIKKMSHEHTGRGIVSNARMHLGRKHVLNLDLKDFFHSISAKRVYHIFLQKPFRPNQETAAMLTLLTTHNLRLPMGAPTSPVLANFAAIGLDAGLTAFSKSHQLTYSRYADDLTFSGNEPFGSIDKSEIKAIILKHGFMVNEKKQRLQSNHQRQTVTGLKVNECLNLDRKYIRNLRAILYSWQTAGVLHATAKCFACQAGQVQTENITAFMQMVVGKIGFVGQVRGKTDDVYLKLQRELELNLELVG